MKNENLKGYHSITFSDVFLKSNSLTLVLINHFQQSQEIFTSMSVSFHESDFTLDDEKMNDEPSIPQYKGTDRFLCIKVFTKLKIDQFSILNIFARMARHSVGS